MDEQADLHVTQRNRQDEYLSKIHHYFSNYLIILKNWGIDTQPIDKISYVFSISGTTNHIILKTCHK